MSTIPDPEAQAVAEERPDTSAGYTRPVRPCPSVYSIDLAVLVAAGATVGPSASVPSLHCVMALGHAGNHRNGGVHWDDLNTTEAPEVTTDG